MLRVFFMLSILLVLTKAFHNRDAEIGNTIALPCIAPQNQEIDNYFWIYQTDSTNHMSGYIIFAREFYHIPNIITGFVDRFHSDRVSSTGNVSNSSDMNLILKNITINSMGWYQCSVKNIKGEIIHRDEYLLNVITPKT